MAKIKIEVSARFDLEIEEEDFYGEFAGESDMVAEAVVEAVDHTMRDNYTGAEYSSFNLGLVE